MNDPIADADGAWGTTEFRPGLDVGLVARRTVGLIARDNPSTRERLWQLVAADAPIDDLLDELSSTGLKALPDFGVVQMEAGGARIVARGRATITAESADGAAREIDASDVRTWVEDVVADVVAVTVTLPAADDDAEIETGSDTFAVLAGSVPASSLTRRFDTADPLARVATGPTGWDPASGATPDADDDGGSSGDDEQADDMPVADLEMPADAAEPDDLDHESANSSVAPGDSWFDDPGAAPGSATPSEPIPPQPAVGDDEPAAEQPSGDDTADPVDPSASLAAVAPAGPGTGAAPPVSDTADIAPPPPVDSTTVLGEGPPGSPGPVTQVFTEDRDGMTMSRDDVEAQRASTDAAPPSPVFAVLAFSNGERIDVDRAVLIGRNPKVSGSTAGGLPHIMKFDGPGQGLSRTHAEVRVEGGELLLEDLHSTNGTEVQLPGQQRRRLRAGEPVVITPGSLIDFGDELHCTVESAG